MGHPSKFQRVSHLGFVTEATSFNGSQQNFARCLAVSWVCRLYIHFRRLLARNGILPGAKFTLRPSLALFYIGSVTALHSSSGRQPNFAALSRGRHLYTAERPSRWALTHILVHLDTDQIMYKGQDHKSQDEKCSFFSATSSRYTVTCFGCLSSSLC